MKLVRLVLVLCVIAFGCGESPEDEGSDGSVRGDAFIAQDASVTLPDGGDASEPPPPSALSELITREVFAEMFPNRNALYTYDAFLAAAAYYPEFGAEGTDVERRREVAAFLANASHETTGGWDTAPGGRFAWGLYFTQEVGCENGACTGYCVAVPEYPCTPGKTYHGRGPIQLSYNYNYGFFSTVLGVDLLADPDAITRDGVLAFRSAFWFWMTPQSPKPSAHDVMTGQWAPSQADLAAGRQPGFGMTVNIINGGLECGIDNDYRVADRIGFFMRYVDLLGTTPGSNLDCENMQSY